MWEVGGGSRFPSLRTNLASLRALNALNGTQRGLTGTLERIGSGLRVNQAADDAAGLGVATNLDTRARSVTMAMRNVNDAIATVDTAEGGLAEGMAILKRMRELAMQASNGTYSAQDRSFMQSEADVLKLELDRLAEATQFNGQRLLDQSFLDKTLQVGVEAGEGFGVSLEDAASDAVGIERINGGTMSAAVLSTQNGAAADANGLVIEGYIGAATTAAFPDSESGKSIADIVNAISHDTGVTASARTTVTSLRSTSPGRSRSPSTGGTRSPRWPSAPRPTGARWAW